jgi:hypothetical protein
MMPARTCCAHTCLLSWVPHVWWVPHVSMLRMWRGRLAHRYARTRRAIPMFSFHYTIVSSASRDRAINSPCDSSAPRFLAARAGLRFGRFLIGFFWGSFFVIFGLSFNFFVINIIINPSLTSSHHQNLLSAVMKSSKLVNTRKMVKNSCFWGSRKRGSKWVFLACFWPHRKITFFWHQHIINTSKNHVFLTSTHH